MKAADRPGLLSDWINREDLAGQLSVTTDTLARWATQGSGPPRTLVARMEDQALDPAPLWDDVASFDGRPWRGAVDILTGGYPCQPFSVAGKRKGADDQHAGAGRGLAVKNRTRAGQRADFPAGAAGEAA